MCHECTLFEDLQMPFILLSFEVDDRSIHQGTYWETHFYLTNKIIIDRQASMKQCSTRIVRRDCNSCSHYRHKIETSLLYIIHPVSKSISSTGFCIIVHQIKKIIICNRTFYDAASVDTYCTIRHNRTMLFNYLIIILNIDLFAK